MEFTFNFHTNLSQLETGIARDSTVLINMLEMDQNLEQRDFGESAANQGSMRETEGREKSNKCNQCDYASLQAGDLRRHLKTHSGEKSNKCNQCDFASSLAGDLRRHLKTHGGEK